MNNLTAVGRSPLGLGRALLEAAPRAGVARCLTTHGFRRSFATPLLEDGYDILTVQELLGHRDVKTTMVYTHVLNRGGLGVHSPLERLRKPMSVETGGLTPNQRWGETPVGRLSTGAKVVSG